MADPSATSTAFNELLDLVRSAEQLFTTGDRAVADPASRLEGYGWALDCLSVAVDCFVKADPLRPELVEVVSATRKWGGDNSDASYRYAAIDPARTYRVRGVRGDAAYLSLTLYGGPDDGRWSTRIVGTANDRSMTVGEDGEFSVVIGPDVVAGPDAIRSESDANALVTRDYLVDPRRGRETTWAIECVDGPAHPPRADDAELAARYRRATAFLADLFAIFPIAADPAPNTVQDPYPVPAATYGWAAGDAAYAMGSFRLDDGEALVLEGRSPACAFWNLCLWNPFLQTYDYRYEDVTINGGQCTYEPDGSWRVVVAAADPGVPNWLSTAGHGEGRLWFRWFLPESTPERPTATVVPVSTVLP